MSKVRPRRHDRAATGRTGPASRLRTRSHPTAPHARARRTSRRPRRIANRTPAATGSCCSTTATSSSPKERNTRVSDRIRMRDLAAMMTRRSLGPGGIDRSLSRGRRTSGRCCPRHAPRSTTRASPACPAPPDAAASRNCETRATLSTTRHHRNDVGAARGVAARQGHRRDPADHRRPPQGQTAASTHSAPTHRSLRAYSSASRPATRPSATAARQITETIPGGRARDPRA